MLRKKRGGSTNSKSAFGSNCISPQLLLLLTKQRPTRSVHTSRSNTSSHAEDPTAEREGAAARHRGTHPLLRYSSFQTLKRRKVFSNRKLEERERESFALCDCSKDACLLQVPSARGWCQRGRRSASKPPAFATSQTSGEPANSYDSLSGELNQSIEAFPCSQPRKQQSRHLNSGRRSWMLWIHSIPILRHKITERYQINEKQNENKCYQNFSFPQWHTCIMSNPAFWELSTVRCTTGMSTQSRKQKVSVNHYSLIHTG